MSEPPKATVIEANMPIKLGGISKRLWPHKTYLRIKANHPIAGSVFATVWTIFWLILAITINLLILLVIVASIAIVLYGIFSGTGTNDLVPDYYPSRKKKKQYEDQY